MENNANPQLKLMENESGYLITLEKKLNDIQNLYDLNIQVLTEIANKKNALNKEEETVQFELSGLNGAIKVIQELIEESKTSKI